MIGRALGLLGVLVACLCVGTVLAETVVLAMLWSRGELSAQRIDAVRAVLTGLDVESLRAAAAERDRIKGSQPSIADLARARADKFRDLEFREQSITQALDQLRSEQLKLAAETDRYKRVKSDLEAQLASLRESTINTHEESVRQIIETIKPAQAKDQLMRMIKTDEMKAAVDILSAMPVARQAKVLGEFKTDEERQRLAEMLKMIREGKDELDAIDGAQDKLKNDPNPP